MTKTLCNGELMVIFQRYFTLLYVHWHDLVTIEVAIVPHSLDSLSLPVALTLPGICQRRMLSPGKIPMGSD